MKSLIVSFLIASGVLILTTSSSKADGAANVVLCESSDYHYNVCHADVGLGSVQLIRQTSGPVCIAGISWGYSANQIWVDQGCSGEFKIYPR